MVTLPLSISISKHIISPQTLHPLFLYSSTRKQSTTYRHQRHRGANSTIFHIGSIGFGTANHNIDYLKDYYKTLNLTKNASKKEIRASYLSFVKQWHPDLFQKESDKVTAESKFKAAQEAYEILHDDTKRKEYDEMRRIKLQQSNQRMRTSHSTQQSPGSNYYDANVHGQQYQTNYSSSNFYSFGNTADSSGWRRGFESHWEEMRENEEEEMNRIEKEWKRIRRRAKFSKQFEVPNWSAVPDDRDFMENPYFRIARCLFICGVACFVSKLVIGKGAHDPRYNRDQFRFVDGRLWRVSTLEKAEREVLKR